MRRLGLFIATCGYIGYVPVAPGTFGSAVGLAVFALVRSADSQLIEALTIVALFAVGVWACEITGRALGEPDHGSMVWDETVAFLLVLFFTPPGPYWQAGAFLTFRVFDIAKPPPIRYYERVIKGGLGTMIDDVAAAFYTLLVLAGARIVIG